MVLLRSAQRRWSDLQSVYLNSTLASVSLITATNLYRFVDSHLPDYTAPAVLLSLNLYKETLGILEGDSQGRFDALGNRRGDL